MEDTSVDIVVHGEGEVTFLEVLNTIKQKKDLSQIPGIAFCRKEDNKVIKTPKRPFVDINTLPKVLWHLLKDVREAENLGEVEKNTLAGFPFQTSRGCPHRCIFCVNSVSWHETFFPLVSSREAMVSFLVPYILVLRKCYHGTKKGVSES